MANSILSTLLFDIQTNTASLKKGLDDAKGMFSGLQNSVKQIGGVIAGAFAVSAILGASKKVGEFIFQIGEATASVRDLTGTSGKELTDLTASIKSTSDTFGTDFNNTLDVTNALSKKMGISFGEAADIIQKGLALNDDNAEQFLGLVKQFSPSFQELGLSAQAIPAILTQIYDSGTEAGTAIGSLSKANENLREMNSSALKALSAIGINGSELKKQIESGAITQFEAVQKISNQLKSFGNNSREVGDVISTVFGKQGVQAGGDFIKSIGQMTTGFDELVKSADPVEQANLRIAQATTELNKVAVEFFGNSSTAWTEMKATALEFAVVALKQVRTWLVDVANYFISLHNESMGFRASIQSIVFQFKTLWEAIKLVGNLIVDTFSGAGKLIKAAFTGNFQEIPNILKNHFKTIADDVKVFGVNTAENFVDAFNATVSKEKIKLIDNDEVANQATNAAKTAVAKIKSVVGSELGDKEKGQKDTDIKPLKVAIAKIKPPAKIDLSKDKKEVKELGNAWEGMSESTGEALGALTSQFQSMGDQGIASTEAVAQATVGAVRRIIAAKIAEAIASTIASNASLGPFALAAIPIAIAGLMAIINSAIPGFERGGVSEGGLAMVGEKGAELVHLSQGSRVYNHSDTNKMLSNVGGNNLHITLDASLKGEQIYFLVREVERKRRVA